MTDAKNPRHSAKAVIGITPRVLPKFKSQKQRVAVWFYLTSRSFSLTASNWKGLTTAMLDCDCELQRAYTGEPQMISHPRRCAFVNLISGHPQLWVDNQLRFARWLFKELSHRFSARGLSTSTFSAETLLEGTVGLFSFRRCKQKSLSSALILKHRTSAIVHHQWTLNTTIISAQSLRRKFDKKAMTRART